MAAEWAARITDAARAVGMPLTSPGLRNVLAAQVEVEQAMLRLKAVTRPEDSDGVVDECVRRAATHPFVEADDSVYRDVCMGWRPGAQAGWRDAVYPLVALPYPQVAQSGMRGWLGRWIHRKRRTPWSRS